MTKRKTSPHLSSSLQTALDCSIKSFKHVAVFREPLTRLDLDSHRKHFASVRALTLLVFLIGASNEAMACRLALILALDVSQSVNSADYALQSQGVARAFRDKEVRAALLDYGEPVASIAFEWSGTGHQTVIADWVLLSKPNNIDRFADQIEQHGRTKNGQKTAIGSALRFASDLLAQGPDCSNWVIDLSSDGYNSAGEPPSQVYEALDFSAITVNALVIGGKQRPLLKRHFETEVIHGPGAFVLSTQSFADYAEAFRRKLLRELRARNVVATADAG